jgi:hypothetical protein
MSEKSDVQGWVYVFVCNPGPKESYLGLYNAEKGLNVIPAFRSKEEANDCFLEIPREKGVKYELQAVHIEELHHSAEEEGFVVTIVDSEGRLVKSEEP